VFESINGYELLSKNFRCGLEDLSSMYFRLPAIYKLKRALCSRYFHSLSFRAICISIVRTLAHDTQRIALQPSKEKNEMLIDNNLVSVNKILPLEIRP
jgi:hypothetical protein